MRRSSSSSDVLQTAYTQSVDYTRRMYSSRSGRHPTPSGGSCLYCDDLLKKQGTHNPCLVVREVWPL